MSSGALICQGQVTIASDGAPLCSGVWSLMAVPEPFDPSQLVLTDLAAMFTYGFGLVGLCCVLGVVGGRLLNLIHHPYDKE